MWPPLSLFLQQSVPELKVEKNHLTLVFIFNIKLEVTRDMSVRVAVAGGSLIF